MIVGVLNMIAHLTNESFKNKTYNAVRSTNPVNARGLIDDMLLLRNDLQKVTRNTVKVSRVKGPGNRKLRGACFRTLLRPAEWRVYIRTRHPLEF